MYTKDKNNRITLRLNEPLFNYVIETSKRVGVSPSEFLRMVIMAAYVDSKEETRRENEQTDNDDKLPN